METEYLLNTGSYSYKSNINGQEYYISATIGQNIQKYYDFTASTEDFADSVESMLSEILKEQNEAELSVCLIESIGEELARFYLLIDLTITAVNIPETQKVQDNNHIDRYINKVLDFIDFENGNISKSKK